MIGAMQVSEIFRPLVPWFVPYLVGAMGLSVGLVLRKSCEPLEFMAGYFVIGVSAIMLACGPMMGYLPGMG